tara:strand:+ start:1122 stop:1361 length:240 start_codon:yes stop_codon:yes gene_type:complete
MKYIFGFFLVFCLSISPVFAYPQTEFDECISSSKENPALANFPEESIEGFCDCALTEIFDKNKIDNLWINSCARKHFKS